MDGADPVTVTASLTSGCTVTVVVPSSNRSTVAGFM